MKYQSLKQEFDRLLGDFTRLCERLIDDGQPFLVVILAHELFRFLYPAEPYADVTHDQPVEFAVNHIRSLIQNGERFREVVIPYKLNLSNVDASEQTYESLERSTSDLYTTLWEDFDQATLLDESMQLLRKRVPAEIIEQHVVGKTVLDLGCGSGRYSIALAQCGAIQVEAVDYQAKSFAAARKWCETSHAPIDFREGDVLDLEYSDSSFDFVFCNGVLHHTHSIEKGLREISRVLKPSAGAFLYLYGAGGIFWETRTALRSLFRRIPISYTKTVLRIIGMPANRFIFCDTWYVPVETHTTTEKLRHMLESCGFGYKKLIGNSSFDLDQAIAHEIPGAVEMWGDGEHRYLLEKL